MKKFFIITGIFIILTVYAAPGLFSKEFDIEGLKRALDFCMETNYEQSRAVLIPYIMHCNDEKLRAQAKMIAGITYYFDSDVDLGLCIIINTFPVELNKAISDNSVYLLGKIADSLTYEHKNEALSISQFILHISPESNNAYYRLGHIYYTFFDDTERAYQLFLEGFRLYPLENYKASRYIYQR